MATDVMPNTEQTSMTKLVGGIIDDTQRLLKQQADLLKADLRREISGAKEVGMSMALAVALMSVGGLLLSFMLAHLLSWAVPDLPLWGSYGIVGGLFAAAGGIVFYLSREKLDKLTPPGEQTVEGLKENLQWKTNPN
jgi:hypothetical protein